MIKVSIITVVYNNKESIAEAIHSVQSQTYKNIEHIIIDGASIDGTIEIINNLKNENSGIISEPDNGIYDALNKGVKKATGDIIGFVHSDDLLASDNTIEKLVDAFIKTRADGIYGDLQYVQKENTSKIIRYWKSKDFDYDNLKYGWMPAHPTFFLKKEVYEKHGLFDTSFRIAADYDFMLRILLDRTLKYFHIPIIISKMRVGGESNKSIKNIIQKSKEDTRAMKKNNIGGLHTLVFKNIRKILQFLIKS